MPSGETGSADAITASGGRGKRAKCPSIALLPASAVPMIAARRPGRRRPDAACRDRRGSTISRSNADADRRAAYARRITDEGLWTRTRLIQFLPLVLIFVVFYFLLIRPQQKKQKDHRAMLDALRRGDRIVTGGGISRHGVESGEPRGGRGRSRPECARAGAAQHDLERAGQARPGRGARGGQGARAPRKPGKRNRPAAPPTRYSDVSLLLRIQETTRWPRLPRQSDRVARSRVRRVNVACCISRTGRSS